jgi:hypothetical protein
MTRARLWPERDGNRACWMAALTAATHKNGIRPQDAA